jgi:type III secretory pathway component EscS
LFAVSLLVNLVELITQIEDLAISLGLSLIAFDDADNLPSIWRCPAVEPAHTLARRRLVKLRQSALGGMTLF